MKKKELMEDMIFRSICCTYGLDWEDFDIFDDIIVLNSPKKNISVLIDNHYNIMGIYDKNDDINKLERLKMIKESYENVYTKLPYPFQDLSLKQIVELANRVFIHETNQGHSSEMLVNGELANDDDDSVYISLLSYIKFLGQQIKQYFMNLYQMKMMGFAYPDVYQYISSLMSNIDECVNVNIQKGIRPFPFDIIKYLGQDVDNIDEYDHALYSVIDLLLKQKGAKIKDDFRHYDEVEPTEKDNTDLSELSKNLLKILEVPLEEVEQRYQERNQTFVTKEVNLQSWLSDNNKDKPPVLIKS